MAEEYDRGLFHKWVPGPAVLFLIVLLESAFLMINPIYSGNIGQMVSSTGINSEYFMWGNFAQTIGMATVLPLVLRIKMRFRSKELTLAALISMALISLVMATTSSGGVVVGGCFIFGMAKMIGMVQFVLPLQFILSPKGDKNRFYAIFYPIAIIAGQLSVLLSSKISLDLDWKALHFYSAGTLMLLALISVIFMHNLRFAKKMPLYRVDWPGILLFATALMGMACIFTFGKQLDWFVSPKIRAAAVISIAAIIILILRQLKIKHPFLSFKLYRKKDVLAGIFLLIGQGMYMGVTSLLSVYTAVILGYNWITNSTLSLMTIPGMLVAGFVAFHWTKHKIPIKMYIFSGFAAFFLYTVMLYFMMVPGLSPELLYLPQLLNGYGTCALFISIWIYTFERVPQNTMLPSVAPIMVFRSFITMALFTALYGWLQYKLQWQSVGDAAFYFDTLAMSFGQGAESMQSVQLGAILSSSKKLYGYTIIAGLGFLIFILFHQFGNQKYQIARYHFWRAEKQKNSKFVRQIATGNIHE